MPAVPKTTDRLILSATLKIVERGGHEAVTMAKIAGNVGIQAPSLYKRFPSRKAVLLLVQLQVFRDLRDVIERSGRGLSPMEALREMAAAYRAYARKHPNAYRLMFLSELEATAESNEARLAAVRPVFDCLGLLGIPSQDWLPTARVFTAFLHGFVTMELSGSFKMGGDIGADFAFGVTQLLRSFGPELPPAVGGARKSGRNVNLVK